jgi:Mlc titration factor MtfA (ptsG expression regulator)
MAGEFERHAQASWSGRPTVMDPYGAQSPAEFFAVAVETYFEKPEAMRAAHPVLYAMLRGHFRLDPAEAWGFGERALSGVA